MKTETYKRKYFHLGCFNPDCESGLEIECHHIIPKDKGGKDEYLNYILLCRKCHRKNKNHSCYESRRTILYTWKFFNEAKERGKIIIQVQEKPKDIICLYCGDPFPYRKGKKYCYWGCQQRHYSLDQKQQV